MTDALKGLEEPLLAIDKPQPTVVWALFFKEHGKRRVVFSYDGPPSPAYVRLIDAKAYDAKCKEVAELVEAVDAYEKEFKNPAIDVLYRRTLREQIFKTLAKFRGKKE